MSKHTADYKLIIDGQCSKLKLNTNTRNDGQIRMIRHTGQCN